ncbi:type II secretion system major pseudopilin GspG [Nitrospirillum pindoramense]|uniref:Type II secretion system core protein G n=1 Tax=Nitrospirillum amazonense TaxID=28077 RepID=A0A560H442_9PROT|nr:type II secretion system major pseudopilin GspG [Nitrospirillum amazonense]TWB41018.1 type II secretion system protein G (GspG) [Nitrospirillum amazonense]
MTGMMGRMARRYRADTARSRGFTLLELLVVVLIIGLLASYVGPKYFAQVAKSEVTTAKAQIEAYAKAVDNFRLDMGRFPTTEEGLAVLMTRPAADGDKWNGPYLRKAIIPDPWGHAYLYRAPGDKGEFAIQSYGRDGQPGGTGPDADLSNE